MISDMNRVTRQTRVGRWVRDTFGDGIAMSLTERAMRLVEEAVEAAQAVGLSQDKVLLIVGRVYNRPPGELAQELGGVGVTLLAFAEAAGLSADRLERQEVKRIHEFPADKFRTRHAEKIASGTAEAHA